MRPFALRYTVVKEVLRSLPEEMPTNPFDNMPSEQRRTVQDFMYSVLMPDRMLRVPRTAIQVSYDVAGENRQVDEYDDLPNDYDLDGNELYTLFLGTNASLNEVSLALRGREAPRIFDMADHADRMLI